MTARGLTEVALGLFDEHGYSEVSVRDIAEAAGVDLRTVHRYFPAKSDVVWGTLVGAFDDLAERLEATPDDLPLVERIRLAVCSSIRADADPLDRRRLRVVARSPELQSTFSPAFVAWRTTIHDFVASHLDESDDLRATALATAVQSVTLAALTWWADHPGTTPEDAVDRALASLAGGFAETS
ncbi:TetR family transcriptional regulator [Nocardioides sp. CFH 31398]|uniref:acyl-CoA-like ligand-binding transcription factor n=1 Tax=Nocardioides sp. CFH 31398 TaxID=2919579 RepID=UPI001F0533FB|nr:TetR family transcriptional regulator [Nocardioides sp. CFH 31398]MCH1865741.1 TetR family transcriptional regulator [Nocardioides sp. CFH 31398]